MTAPSRRFRWSGLALAGVLTMTLELASISPAAAFSQLNCYLQHNLVSNGAVPADQVDANLVNAWGLSSSATSPFWVSDNGTGVTTLYNGEGQSFPVASPLVVTIPPPPHSAGPSTPTGQVFNQFAVTNPPDFVVSSGGASGTSFFIFATEDGTISAWNPTVPPPVSSAFSTTAVLVVDNSASGAVYKGLAIGGTSHGLFLYAANFHAGTIDVFDGQFNPALFPPGAFVDPNLPDGFAPFNIQNLDGHLYVTYALQNDAKHDDVKGSGNGWVDVFDTDGNLLQTVAVGGQLNSPWGLVLAPDDFGPFSGDLLVGNFGDGFINAYRPLLGGGFFFDGALRTDAGDRVSIDGLWALRFGNGSPNSGPTNTLFFTAGPNDEKDGLFGKLDACIP
ncbi:MAG TPA: TIGR03118 family protein [Candidatus Binatia bacterium]|nr:TIGR03118 family protein [Candidatus Binatia bacterium]